MIRITKNISVGLALLSLFVFCKRTQKDGVLGPELKTASQQFAIVDSFKVFGQDKSMNFESPIVDLSRAETTYVLVPELDDSGVPTGDTIPEPVIKFKQRNTYFKARFNEEVHWRIEIKPKNASPVGSPSKLIKGTSQYIDSIPEWTWDGSSDNQYHFTPGNIDFIFTVIGHKDTTVISKSLVKTAVLDSSSAILLNDFEGGIAITPYGDNNDKIGNPEPGLVDYIPFTPQGKRALLLTGTDHNGDYFVGGNQQVITKGMLAGHPASDIYLNLYIYGFPPSAGLTPNATKIGIGVSQDNRFSDGTFDPKTEDTFDQQISVDWVGWKLVSVKYSNLKRSTAQADGGSGPNKLQPETAVSVGCNILSSPNGSTVGAALDYLIITFGKPLEK